MSQSCNGSSKRVINAYQNKHNQQLKRTPYKSHHFCSKKVATCTPPFSRALGFLESSWKYLQKISCLLIRCRTTRCILRSGTSTTNHWTCLFVTQMNGKGGMRGEIQQEEMTSTADTYLASYVITIDQTLGSLGEYLRFWSEGQAHRTRFA